MVKYRKLKISVITVLFALIIALSSAALAAFNRTVSYADDTRSYRYVALDGNTVFYTAIRGAEIVATDPMDPEAGETEQARYTQFNIGKDETVEYRQNLAYAWKEPSAESGLTSSERKFSMTLSFKELNFKRFIIRLQSQQYVYTEEGKTENYFIFEPLNVGIRFGVSQWLEEDDDGNIKAQDDNGVTKVLWTDMALPEDGKFKISFGAYKSGNYEININDVKLTQIELLNVYEYFATYVSSGDNAVTPLTFSAQFKEDAGESADAQMILYELNGQSFSMHENGGIYKVRDDAAPAICFSQTPSYLEYGKTVGFKYKVIDVLSNSPRAVAYYYVLKGSQFASDEFDYDKTDYEEKSDKDSSESDGGSDGEENTDLTENPFIQITSSSNNRIIRDADTFIPLEMLEKESNVYGLVKIYYEIYDYGSASTPNSTANKQTIHVDWYAKDSALVNIYDYKAETEANKDKISNFFKLIDGKDGVTYAKESDLTQPESGDYNPLEAYKTSVKQFQEYYQDRIDETIKNFNEEGKLYAGSDKKFYLPAIELNYKTGDDSEPIKGVFLDDYCNGTDYKYSIYYRTSKTGSATSLDFNKLAIDLKDADVTYQFTIFITDSMGNPMRYPDKDESGNLIWKEITTSDIWDEDYSDLLPYFEFPVSYKEATSEDPEKLSISYVGTSYSGVSFKIDGVSDTYTSDYNLYVFDRNAYAKDKGVSIDYEEFTDKLRDLFDDETTRKYFRTVKASDSLLETDPNYEEYKAINWNSSNLSFVPQSIDDFYVVELTLTDNRSQLSTRNYATVAASVQTTPLKGESDWVENNLTSVILLTISGVCLIALIVLLIVKPKDKGDIDAVYSEVEAKSEKKKKNKK